MFTRTIRSHILGKSAVKWDINESGSSASKKSTYEQLIDPSLKPQDRKAFLNKLELNEVSDLQENLLKKLSKKELRNEKWANEVLDQLRDVYKEKTSIPNPIKPSVIAGDLGVSLDSPATTKLTDTQNQKNDAVVKNNDIARGKITISTVNNIKELQKDIKIDKKSSDFNATQLANLDGDKYLDGKTQNIVTEKVLFDAIQAIQGKGITLDKIYENVTGKAPEKVSEKDIYTSKSIEDFRTALISKLSSLQAITGSNAGLLALLAGQYEDYIVAINTKEGVIAKDTNKSTTTENTLGAVGTLGVAYATQGVVTVGHERDAIEADQFIEELKKGQSPDTLGKIGKGLVYLKEVFMGRRLSLDLGTKDKKSVEEYKKSILSETEKIMNLSDIAAVKSAYPDVAKVLDKYGDKKLEDLKKDLIEAYIVNEGYKNSGSDWTAKLGLGFIGANRDSINMSAQSTNVSDFNKIEQDVLAKVFKSDTKGEAIINESTSSNQVSEKIDSLRDLSETDKRLLQARYTIGHLPYSNTNARTFLEAVSRGNIALANSSLEDLIKDPNMNKYLPELNIIKGDMRNIALFDTSTSGSRKTREISGSVDSKNAANIRTGDVIKAEQALAKSKGFPEYTDEQKFALKGNEKHTPVPASSFFDGRSMTVVQLMTPLGWERGTHVQGVHRASIGDGSFSISDKIEEIADPSKKTKIIDGLLQNSDDSRGIIAQVEKFKAFLNKENVEFDSNQINSQYINYLKTDDLGVFGIPELSLQSGKGTKIIEGRAMVEGGVCLNRMYAIGYPLFTIEKKGGPVLQEGQKVIDMDATLNIVDVDADRQAIGVNPVGAYNKYKDGGGGKPKGSTGSGDDGTVTPDSADAV